MCRAFQAGQAGVLAGGLYQADVPCPHVGTLPCRLGRGFYSDPCSPAASGL